VFACAIPAQSSPPRQIDVPSETPSTGLAVKPVDSVPQEAPRTEEPPVEDSKLAAYLADSALTWVQSVHRWKDWPDCAVHPKICLNYEKVEHETVSQTRDRIKSIARDIASAAAVERGAWPDDITKGHTAIMVLTLGFEETLFRGYVDDGRCNDPKWRPTPEGYALMGVGGNCDGGVAHTIWQIHVGDGIALFPNPTGKGQDWRHIEGKIPQAKLDEDLAKPIGLRQFVTKENIGQSRLLAARTAWRMVRQSLRNGGFTNLCAYTGELGPCPKGAIRLNFANNWWQKHPFTPTF